MQHAHTQPQEFRVWRKVTQLLSEIIFSFLHSPERLTKPACRIAAALLLRVTLVTPKAMMPAFCDAGMTAARNLNIRVQHGSLA
jgi:hypothetical protein